MGYAICKLLIALVIAYDYIRRDGQLQATFTNHTQPVMSFVAPAEDAGPRLRGCVMSVARDNSVAVISAEELSW